MLADFRGIVVLVSNELRWRSWATSIWSMDGSAPLVPAVADAGKLSCNSRS
jgi:hypothetical protein